MTKVKAQAKWVRISARKVRIIMDLIRGKAAGDAVRLLKVMPHKAARIVEKVLLSAVANAKNNYKLSENELFVTEIFADSAAMLKRWQARAKGRAFPIKKRTSHVTVYVGPKAEVKQEEI